MKWEEGNMAIGLYITQNGSVMVSYGPNRIAISSAQYKANGYMPQLEKLLATPLDEARAVTDAPWKAADAEWFERHPDRTHHARAPMKGEAANLGVDSDPTPPQMELTILVRQVEPGRRLRSAFFKPTDLPLPDVEPLAHALMDLALRPRVANEPIERAELMELWRRYEAVSRLGPTT
jgi:hypothetical protein